MEIKSIIGLLFMIALGVAFVFTKSVVVAIVFVSVTSMILD